MAERTILSNGLRYRQVYRRIAEDIAKGAIGSGDRLPSERELCERFSVSRATIRRAIKQLAEDGLAKAHHGAGTFVVSSGPLGEAPNALMSFTELGAARGLVATAKVFEAVVRTATLDESERFEIAPGAEVFSLKRLRYLDGLPICVDESCVPLALAHSLPHRDFGSESLYAALKEDGAAPVRADYTVESIAADAPLAEYLSVPLGSPILKTRTLSYDQAGRLVEVGEMAFRGDRYRFRATLTKRSW